jgi:hypothetical protein
MMPVTMIGKSAERSKVESPTQNDRSVGAEGLTTEGTGNTED